MWKRSIFLPLLSLLLPLKSSNTIPSKWEAVDHFRIPTSDSVNCKNPFPSQTKDAVRMQELRKELVSERQALKKEQLRQKMDSVAMNNVVAKEKEAAREARAAVDEIHEALSEAKRALRSLQNAAHVASKTYSLG